MADCNSHSRYSPTELNRLQNFLLSAISGAVSRYIFQTIPAPQGGCIVTGIVIQPDLEVIY